MKGDRDGCKKKKSTQMYPPFAWEAMTPGPRCHYRPHVASWEHGGALAESCDSVAIAAALGKWDKKVGVLRKVRKGLRGPFRGVPAKRLLKVSGWRCDKLKRLLVNSPTRVPIASVGWEHW